MKQGLWVLALVVLCGDAGAEQWMQPQDFAYGVELTPGTTAPLYRAPLPASVYFSVTQPDLADMRVFNAAGQQVPHTLRRPADKEPEGVQAPVPFFPLQIASGAKAAEFGRKAVQAYVLDLGEPAKRIGQPSAVGLQWQGGPDGVVAPVRVEGSDDLDLWRPLVERATLARMRYAGQLLEQTRIELPESTPRYLRLIWPEALWDAVLTEALAYYPGAGAAPKREWVELEGVKEEPGLNAWVYELPGPMPIDRAGPLLPDGNVLITAALSSRTGGEERWHLRYEGAFYRLAAEDARFEHTTAALDGISDSQWRLATSAELPGTQSAPGLRLGWRPHELYFLASGDAPYLLAFGAAKVTSSPPTGVEELLARLEQADNGGMVAEASPSAQRLLGGEARLLPASPDVPWRRVILWGLLVLSVLLLSWMAWRLWQQMTYTDGG